MTKQEWEDFNIMNQVKEIIDKGHVARLHQAEDGSIVVLDAGVDEEL